MVFVYLLIILPSFRPVWSFKVRVMPILEMFTCAICRWAELSWCDLSQVCTEHLKVYLIWIFEISVIHKYISENNFFFLRLFLG